MVGISSVCLEPDKEMSSILLSSSFFAHYLPVRSCCLASFSSVDALWHGMVMMWRMQRGNTRQEGKGWNTRLS